MDNNKSMFLYRIHEAKVRLVEEMFQCDTCDAEEDCDKDKLLTAYCNAMDRLEELEENVNKLFENKED